jgi:hypothetical protein
VTDPVAGATPADRAPGTARAAPLADPRWGVLALAVALLAIAASATSLRNGFTYDDRWIIADNGRVHELRALWRYFEESYWPMSSGAGLYRPLVIFAYSVQWAIGGGSPLAFHTVNVLLAAACAVAAFWMMGFLVPTRVAWVAAALFAVHPVHVEAVANVVGQAELWAALVLLLAMGLYLHDRRIGALRRETGVAIVALFLVGIFCKEHVIALPLLLVAAELTLFDDGSAWARLDRLRLLLWPLVAVVGVFLAIRVQVLGDLAGDVPHPSLVHKGMIERVFIMLNVVPEYGRLMLAPLRLYADYSPRQLEVYATPDPSQLSGAFLLLCTLALFVLTLRRAKPVAFGIAWFALLVGPVSNVLLPTGILLAERTLYLPSAGAMLVVAVGVDLLRTQLRAQQSTLTPLVPLAVTAALVFGVTRSSTRNAFWHDTDSAFKMMVEESPFNFKAHYAWGGHLFERRLGREAEYEWRVAIALMPEYHGVYMDLAHKYREAHLCNAAIPLYQKALALEPEATLATVSIAACQLELAQWRRARTTSRVAIADGMYKRAFRYIVDRADSALVANDSLDPTIGAKWLAKAHTKADGIQGASPVRSR